MNGRFQFLPCREDDGGGGPFAEERMVEGARQMRRAPATPSVTPSSGRATSPVVCATGEENAVTMFEAP